MTHTERRPERAHDSTEEKSTDGRGCHAKRGLPGKVQKSRSIAPDWADDKVARAVAFEAYRDDRDPADVWDEIEEFGGGGR